MLQNDGDGWHNNRQRVKSLALNKKLIEEKKKRERELLKKALANGVDYLGDTEFKVNEEAVKSCWQRFMDSLEKSYSRNAPF